MSITVRGETIVSGGTIGGSRTSVSDGLILHLDTANNRSYPGSGTTWNDLTSYQNNIIVSGSGSSPVPPTYSTEAAGCLYFNDNYSISSNYADFYAPINSSTLVTVETWCKLLEKAPPSGYPIIFGWQFYCMFLQSGVGLGYNTFSGDIYGISDASIDNLGLIGNWKHYVFVMRGDNSAYGTANKMYINGDNQSLSQISGTPNTSNINFNNGLGRIANSRRTGAPYYADALYSVFKVYNRELTQSEITQNYNALKNRFGIY